MNCTEMLFKQGWQLGHDLKKVSKNPYIIDNQVAIIDQTELKIIYAMKSYHLSHF